MFSTANIVFTNCAPAEYAIPPVADGHSVAEQSARAMGAFELPLAGCIRFIRAGLYFVSLHLALASLMLCLPHAICSLMTGSTSMWTTWRRSSASSASCTSCYDLSCSEDSKLKWKSLCRPSLRRFSSLACPPCRRTYTSNSRL